MFVPGTSASLTTLSVGLLLLAAGCEPSAKEPPPPLRFDTLISDDRLTFDGVDLGGKPAEILAGTEHSVRVSLRILDDRLRAPQVKWRFDVIGSNGSVGRIARNFATATLKSDPDHPDYATIEADLPITDVERELYEIKLHVDTGNERFYVGGWPAMIGQPSERRPEPDPKL